MAINVGNTAAALSGDTLLTAQDAATITGLHTFSRSPSAPIAVTSGSAVVTNLDADMVDGKHAADLGGADPTAVVTISNVWTFTTNPVLNANAIPETAIADGAVFPRLAGTEAVTGAYTFTLPVRTKAGSSAALVARSGGVIYSQITSVGNVGTGEDTLFSQSVPASTLAVDGDTLVLEAFGTTVADAGTKTLRFKWDGSAFHTIVETTAGANWHARYLITRRGATSQVIGGSTVTKGALVATAASATGAATLSGAVTLSITGEGVNNNDLTVELVRVYWEPVQV